MTRMSFKLQVFFLPDLLRLRSRSRFLRPLLPLPPSRASVMLLLLFYANLYWRRQVHGRRRPPSSSSSPGRDAEKQSNLCLAFFSSCSRSVVSRTWPLAHYVRYVAIWDPPTLQHRALHRAMRRIGPADQRPLTDLACWDRRVFHESKSRDFVAEHELSARRLLFCREPLLDGRLMALDAR